MQRCAGGLGAIKMQTCEVTWFLCYGLEFSWLLFDTFNTAWKLVFVTQSVYPCFASAAQSVTTGAFVIQLIADIVCLTHVCIVIICFITIIPKQKLRFPAYQISWVSDW